MLSIAQLKEFTKVSRPIEFQAQSREEKYQWIETILNRFKYFGLKKRDRTTIKEYLLTMTGFSDAQITRLIAKKKKVGKILINQSKRHKFNRTYTPEDVALLIETDKAHEKLSGPATKRILAREYLEYGKETFKRIKDISVAHIYNFRKTRQYISLVRFFTRTKPTKVNIGERRKPDPQGQPGYLRVDTVHQGDLDKEKGVYHVNIVDEVTQWEIVGCVEKISERYLAPLLEQLIAQFPFKVMGFHSDNGSEYINHVVAKLLNKLLIQQTKSRARRCNDNALVETKNGSIIRKHMGYHHLPVKYAPGINSFYQNYLNPYLNYHRPCGFATITIDGKGRRKKVYNVYQTPFEALRGHPGGQEFMKDGLTLEKLALIAKSQSDNEAAQEMQKAKQKLFNDFSKFKSPE